jgi:hypothetical protein
MLEDNGGGSVPPVEVTTDFETWGGTDFPRLFLLVEPEIHDDDSPGDISESSWMGLEWGVGAVDVAGEGPNWQYENEEEEEDETEEEDKEDGEEDEVVDVEVVEEGEVVGGDEAREDWTGSIGVIMRMEWRGWMGRVWGGGTSGFWKWGEQRRCDKIWIWWWNRLVMHLKLSWLQERAWLRWEGTVPKAGEGLCIEKKNTKEDLKSGGRGCNPGSRIRSWIRKSLRHPTKTTVQLEFCKNSSHFAWYTQIRKRQKPVPYPREICFQHLGTCQGPP